LAKAKVDPSRDSIDSIYRVDSLLFMVIIFIYYLGKIVGVYWEYSRDYGENIVGV